MKSKNMIVSMSFLLGATWARAEDKPVSGFAPYAGEIAAKTLHVRSGPSTNYYPVARLNSGARVQVAAVEAGWLAISPPPGCFSLIASKFLDKGDGTNGTVNADNVRVRAGSDLSPHNYAIQLKLSKGAQVKVLGPMDAEFTKIEPPAGARVWIASEYVRPVQGNMTDAAATGPAPVGTSDPSTPPTESPTGAPAPAVGPAPTLDYLASAPEPAAVQPSGEAEASSGDEDGAIGSGTNAAPAPRPATASLPPSPAPAAPASSSTAALSEPPSPSPDATKAESDARQKELDALDQRLSEEMAKPILNRDLASLLPRYRDLAQQGGDEYSQAYSRVRVQQIEAALEMIEGVKTVGRLKDEIHTVRQTSLTERSNIRYLPVRTDGGFDIEGELRPSAVFESPIGPQRYRLVDPHTSPTRTLGYVEIPADAQVDLSHFIGRRVGVRARQRILSVGDVDPLSIYMASELVALATTADGSSQTTVSVRIPEPRPASSATGTSTAYVP